MKTLIAKADTVVEPASTRWALASLSLAMLLSSLGTSIANVGLPTLAQAFNASFQDVQWVVLSYLVAITTLIVSVGRLGDVIGRRRLLLSGITLFTGASLLSAAAPSLVLLIAARAVQGLGAAVMMALTMAFVGDIVAKSRTGSVMGLLGTMSATGTALGPALGGSLIAACGWPALFLINVPLGVLTLALAYRFLPADSSRLPLDSSKFDPLGSVVLTLTLAAYALAMTMGKGRFDALNLLLLMTAIGGLALLVLVEKKVAAPLINLALFGNKVLSASLALNLLVATVMMATLVVGPFYLSRTLALKPVLVGVVLSIGPMISALTGVLAGRAVDRFGASSMVITGLGVMAAGATALVILPPLFGVGGYIAAIIVLTPGYQLFMAANNTAVMMDVQANQRGVIAAMLGLSRNLGLISGASVMGAIFTVGAATSNMISASPAAVAAGMMLTFVVAALLLILALAIVWLNRPAR